MAKSMKGVLFKITMVEFFIVQVASKMRDLGVVKELFGLSSIQINRTKLFWAIVNYSVDCDKSINL